MESDEILKREVDRFRANWPNSVSDIVAVVGPTAVGKSRFAIALAESVGGEIVSSDAYQVFRGMDIGTAKVSADDQARVPHHLIDIRDPTDGYSVVEFLAAAAAAIADIRARNRPVIMCGGTGFYVRAFLFGYEFSPVPRRHADDDFVSVSWDDLAAVDPVRAAAIHPQDSRRISRALTIYHQTNTQPSAMNPVRLTPRSDVSVVGLMMDRAQLVAQISSRVKVMLDTGLVAEVARLLAQGVAPESQSMAGIGYKEVVAHLDALASGHVGSVDDLVDLISQHTRQFAKRQMTWFRKLPNIEWITI